MRLGKASAGLEFLQLLERQPSICAEQNKIQKAAEGVHAFDSQSFNSRSCEMIKSSLKIRCNLTLPPTVAAASRT